MHQQIKINRFSFMIIILIWFCPLPSTSCHGSTRSTSGQILNFNLDKFLSFSSYDKFHDFEFTSWNCLFD